MVIKRVKTNRQIFDCFPVMVQLRPLLEEAHFVQRISRQVADGYRIAAVFDGQIACAVAAYRVSESLSRGRNLYVDDLVTDKNRRSQGLGKMLLDWLVAEARREKCQQMVLDSGVQRFAAHRFYLRHGMNIEAHHFVLELDSNLS
jgi:GNAT superfamily N-acetyltransferase